MRAWGRTAMVVAVALGMAIAVVLVGNGGPNRPQQPAVPTSASTRAPRISTAPATTIGASTSTAPNASGATDPAPPASPATAAVDRLVVSPVQADLPDYRRDAFGDGWDYDSETGCNTRERVLIAEAVTAPAVDDRCRPVGGTWRSPYDGLVTSDPADLEIDHLVPLADAWRSGAWAWTDDRRRAFANQLDHPDELVAVSSRANRSKGDSTPDEWLPPAADDRCAYVTSWVAVKERWELSVTPAEKAALVQLLAGC